MGNKRVTWRLSPGNYDYVYQLSKKWGVSSVNAALNALVAKIRDGEGYIHPSDLESGTRADEKGWVYVLSDGTELYKIGCSRFPDDRKRDLQAGSSRLITEICRIECAYTKMPVLEKLLHERFKHKRRHREWFELSQYDLDWIISNQASLAESFDGSAVTRLSDSCPTPKTPA